MFERLLRLSIFKRLKRYIYIFIIINFDKWNTQDGDSVGTIISIAVVRDDLNTMCLIHPTISLKSLEKLSQKLTIL